MERRKTKIYFTIFLGGKKNRWIKKREDTDECSHHGRIRYAISLEIPFHIGFLSFFTCRKVSGILSFFQWMPWIECLKRDQNIWEENREKELLPHHRVWENDYPQYRRVNQELKKEFFLIDEYSFVRRDLQLKFSVCQYIAFFSSSSPAINNRLAFIKSWTFLFASKRARYSTIRCR